MVVLVLFLACLMERFELEFASTEEKEAIRKRAIHILNKAKEITRL